MWNEPFPEQLAQIPRLYSSKNIPFPDKLIYLHFFLGINEWFVTEYDGENVFAGYSTEKEQWGHFYFDELKRLQHQGVEVDCNAFWQVKPAKEIPEIFWQETAMSSGLRAKMPSSKLKTLTQGGFMKEVDYTVRKESVESMIRAGRFNPALLLSFRDESGTHTHTISAGHHDDLEIYQDDEFTYALQTNPDLDYVGLEVFRGAEKHGEVFFEGHQAEEFLPLLDNPVTLINRMLQHIQ